MYTSSMQAIVDVSPTFAAITAPTNEVADEARLEYHDGQARLSELCASHGIAVHHVQANNSDTYAPTRFNECRDLWVEVEALARASRRATVEHETHCKSVIAEPEVAAEIREHLVEIADSIDNAVAVVDAALTSVRQVEGALVASRRLEDALRSARGGNRLTTGIHQTDATPDVVAGRVRVLAGALDSMTVSA